jgi:hypothetical protein
VGEKPVKPEQYVRLICERLGVDFDQQPNDLVLDDLRRELIGLAKTAGREELEQVIRILKK